MVKLLENSEGAEQSIRFDLPEKISSHTQKIILTANSDSGLPVQFCVIAGPAIVEKNVLIFLIDLKYGWRYFNNSMKFMIVGKL
jgi:hypothetical protein